MLHDLFLDLPDWRVKFGLALFGVGMGVLTWLGKFFVGRHFHRIDADRETLRHTSIKVDRVESVVVAKLRGGRPFPPIPPT